MQDKLSVNELYDWEEKPWLTALTYATIIFCLIVLLLLIAFWRAPTWRAQLSPVATLYHQTQQRVALLPNQTWDVSPDRIIPPLPPKKEDTAALLPPKLYKGTPRWLLNSTPITVPAGYKKIAIVLDDIGVNIPLSEAAITGLPKEITLAFLPYGAGTKSQAELARLKGHEIMVHLPMEPEGTAYPGPNALFTRLNTSEVQKRVRQNLGYLKHLSVGVNNHMGSKVTKNAKMMRTVLQEVANEKLFFLDSVTTPRPASRKLRKNYPIPILQRDVFIDHYIDEAKVMYYLEKLEKAATKNGQAIGIGHPHPETLRALKRWIPTLEKRGFALVPVTAVLN